MQRRAYAYSLDFEDEGEPAFFCKCETREREHLDPQQQQQHENTTTNTLTRMNAAINTINPVYLEMRMVDDVLADKILGNGPLESEFRIPFPMLLHTVKPSVGNDDVFNCTSWAGVNGESVELKLV